MRIALAAGAAALLAGCGSQPPAGNTTVTSSGAGDTARVEGAGAAIAINAKDCKHPGFAPLHGDARIITCVADEQDPSEKRGSVIYESAAAPAEILAWSKAEGVKSGLRLNFENDMSVSMSEEGPRTLMVMVMTRSQGSGSAVTVNWGEKQ